MFSLWFPFAIVTAPTVFLKRNKPDVCPLDEWQCMVLSETLGLWLRFDDGRIKVPSLSDFDFFENIEAITAVAIAVL